LHSRRLRELELKQAHYGLNTPVEILTEMDSLRATIRAIETTELLKDDTLHEDRRQDHRIHIMIATVQATVAEVSSIKVFIKEEIQRTKQQIEHIWIALAFFFIVILIILTIKPALEQTQHKIYLPYLYDCRPHYPLRICYPWWELCSCDGYIHRYLPYIRKEDEHTSRNE